jgi:DNA-binding transcriptional ArsR family regulator
VHQLHWWLKNYKSNGELMEAKDIVLEVLKKEGNPLSAGQITEISGLERKEVDKAMKVLKDEELIVSPRRCYWEAKK